MTDLAREALAEDRSAMLANQVDCIVPGPPALMAGSVPISVAIDDKTVTFDIDGGQTARRIVHLGQQHPVDPVSARRFLEQE